jgi:osmotically-inducible protein OsmY
VSEARHLQRKTRAPSAGRLAIAGARAGFAVLIAILLGAAGSCLAQDAAKKKANAPLDEVVVQGAREAADEQITLKVQTALSNDPWIYAEHVTVTTQNGIVRVEGITSDPWEMRRILREARKTPGVRRVLNQLEMIHLDPDGG